MDSCARVLYQNMGLKARNGRVQVMQIFKRLPQTVTSRHLEEEKARMDLYTGDTESAGFEF